MKTKTWVVILSVAIALFLTTGTSAAAEKGPIHFVMITDLTGPAHAQVSPQGWASEDYIKYLDKQGGINGHPLTIEVIDTKYQLPLIRTAYARNKDRKQVAVSFDALSGGIEALKGQFATDKIPVLMLTGHGPALYPSSWVFAEIVPYDDTPWFALMRHGEGFPHRFHGPSHPVGDGVHLGYEVVDFTYGRQKKFC